jgi:hypothetical protein
MGLMGLAGNAMLERVLKKVDQYIERHRKIKGYKKTVKVLKKLKEELKEMEDWA